MQASTEGGTIDVQPIFGGPGPALIDVPGVPGRYDHPLFTLNAFAFTDRGIGAALGLGTIPVRIVKGEGLIEALNAIGLGKNGPDYVHAHEFAHHVQFELPAAIPPPPPPLHKGRRAISCRLRSCWKNSTPIFPHWLRPTRRSRRTDLLRRAGPR